MEEVKEIVNNIVKELDGRKGFDFYYIDEDILEEIKEELVKLISPFIVNANHNRYNESDLKYVFDSFDQYDNFYKQLKEYNAPL